MWNFRPSALRLPNYSTQLRENLTSLYQQDGQQATKEEVTIPPKPTDRTILRTLQWNVHAFVNADCKKTRDVSNGIIQTILEANADIIVLNEYTWDGLDSRHQRLQKLLKERGYQFHCGSVFAPTFLATRLPCKTDIHEVMLSVERSALMVQVQAPGSQKPVLVVGTHLDYCDGLQRQHEMSVFLQHLPSETGGMPTVLMGDLNQQRPQDYLFSEWCKILAGMDHRKSCRDDHVADMLQTSRFVCAWNNTGVKTNWTTDCPPSTHWSGTIVDYSYGRNIQARGVYISPVGLSDHRMTICDWQI